MKKILFFPILTVLLYSCGLEAEEEINWNIGVHADMLIVESILTNEFKEQTIQLTLSNPYFDSSGPEALSGATVTVTDGMDTYHFLESANSPGLYISENPFACEEQRTYKMTVFTAEPVNGISEYTASCQMPEGFEMDSASCEIYALPEFDFDVEEDRDTAILVIYYFGDEPVKSENYYFTKTSVNGKLIGKNPKEYNYFNRSYDNTGYVFIDSYLKNVFQDDTIHFTLYTINRDYYHYLESLKMMDNSGNAMSMSGPPANAVGNIENALGYFLTACVSEKSALARDMR